MAQGTRQEQNINITKEIKKEESKLKAIKTAAMAYGKKIQKDHLYLRTPTSQYKCLSQELFVKCS